MANLRAIRMRIKSVESTRQITKSMKMVAAAKLRKTQSACSRLRSYAEKSEQMLRALGGGLPAGNNPFLQPRKEGKLCYVLIVGNRGLCGTYNQALLRYCEKLVREDSREISLICCGRWGKDLIRAAGLTVEETVEISDTPTREEATTLAEKLKKLYRDGEADEVILVYQKYRTVLAQIPGHERLLPIPYEADSGSGDVEQIFDPDREDLVNTLLDMYIGNTVHAALLEARTGEHSARMTAMTAASDNTEELINDLTLELNHARQAAITTEITEIASGAEALRNSQAGG